MNKLIKTPIRNFSFNIISKCQERFKISNGVKILIILMFLPFAPAQAQIDNLVVEFEQTPLFNEANFLPGEGVSRWVKVTNNSGQAQRIAIQPLNITDLDRLGDVLNLEIKERGVVRYSNALSTFFAGGENYLSDLANGTTTQYDLTISFYSGSQNTFQGKTLGFDILIGFQGTEGGILPGAGSASSGGGGGGSNGPPGGLPPGLTIQNEANINVTENSATITWQTSYSATSQVIYALEGEAHTLDLTDTAGVPPKYGYARTTPEYDAPANINGKLFHSVTISGLTPGTTYYYRAVSHGSLAISAERSFTTLTLEEMAMAKTETTKAAVPTLATTEALPAENEEIQIQEQEKEQQEAVSLEGSEENNEGKNLAAAFLGFLNSNPLYWLIIIVILLILIYLLWRQTKDEKTY